MMKKIAAAFLLLAAFATAVQAQQPATAIIVTTCGTTPFTYTAGQFQPVVQDVNGKLCSTASISGGTITAVPQTGTTTATTLTIQSTNVFQQALAANASRKGCVLQNKSNNTQYVFFGVIGSATTSLSLQSSPLQSIYCSAPGVLATDAVNITGTAGDSYVVLSQ